MATYYLINNVLVGGVQLDAGDLIDDASQNVTQIAAAGGLLWPSADPIVAAAAAVAQSAKKNRGANEATVESIMQTAVQSAQKRDDQSGTATLVAGVVTVATGVTITATSKVYVSVNTPGGTMGAHHKVPVASLVVGGPGVGAFTVTAIDTSGATVATDTSSMNWHVIG